MSGGRISRNTAEHGAGIYMRQGKFYMSAGEISDNNSWSESEQYHGKGGGIYSGNGRLTITGGTISGNQALFGGGIFSDAGTNVTISGKTVITGNTAENSGGGIDIESPDAMNIADGVVICNNTSGYMGADVTISCSGKIKGFNCSAASMNSKYKDTGNFIDDWYKDDDGTHRYQPSSTAEAMSLADISKASEVNIAAGYKQINVTYRFMEKVPQGAVLPDSADVDKWTKYTAVQPDKVAGYRFDGWYTDKAMQNKFVDGTALNSSINLYGKWDKTYKATYKFVSNTPAMTLPHEVEKLVPVDDNEYLRPDDIPELKPSQTEVATENGIWTFKDYDKMSTEDGIEFTGKWSYAAHKTYKVSYSFINGTDSTALPDEVTKLKPTDSRSYIRGTEITPKQPSQTDVTAADGTTWRFMGYDKDSAVIEDADIEFKGTWQRSYKVSYDAKSGTEGKTLPKDILEDEALTPKDANTYIKGDKIDPVYPKWTAVVVSGETWTFTGYTPAEATVDNADISFTGTWENVPKTYYSVAYVFVSEDTSMEIPDEVNKHLPVDTKLYERNEWVTPIGISGTTVETEDGVWEFDYYNDPAGYIGEYITENITITGYWKYTAKPRYSVKYEFVSSTTGKELPDGIAKEESEGGLKPHDSSTYVSGKIVTAIQPAAAEYSVEDGTWKFFGYDAEAKRVESSDVTFTGYWEFEKAPVPVKYHKVIYQFDSKTQGMNLPDEVKALLPKDDTEYAEGTFVTAKWPEKTSVSVTDGVWNFKGYDNWSVTIRDKDETFTGCWEYTDLKQYSVSYDFVSGTEGRTLPDEVRDLLPEDTKLYYEGEIVTAIDPAKTVVFDRAGIWYFSSYDRESVVVEKENVTFTGSWVYSEQPGQTYNAVYVFASATEGKTLPDAVKALLPTDSTEYYEGQAVNAIAPAKTKVPDGDGNWDFRGYDKDSAVVVDEDVKFIGSWSYSEEPVPVKYIWVSYEFTGDVPESAALPASARIETGTAYTAAKQAGVSGYSFDGWFTDKACTVRFADGTVLNADTMLYGRWTKKASPHTDTSVRNRDNETAGSSYRGWYKDTSAGDANGVWYYYDDNGMLVKGWHYDEQDGKWYYLSLGDGHMLTGWQLINGRWYYLNPTAPAQTWDYDGTKWTYNGSVSRPYGSMYAGELTPDSFSVGIDGAWDGRK